MDPQSLDLSSRDQLIERARRLGVTRPELLTRVELKDEIVRRSVRDEPERQRLRGWLGVARDLLASVVEQGLHLPDAAALIRGDVRVTDPVAGRPVATVTLAEIYAAQGHLSRALSMLDEVLDKEPDHDAARNLRQRLAERTETAAPSLDDAAAARPAEDFLALLRAGERVLLYWELSDRTRQRLAAAPAVLRVLSAVPSWDGAIKQERSVEVHEPQGAAELSERADAVVRAAIGRELAGRFVPLCVATELSADAEVTWQAPRRGPEPNVVALARERAGRAFAERLA